MMRLQWITGMLLPVLASSAGQAVKPHYRVALPRYHYEFPRDNFNHSDFQTEWWYYTGNLKCANGRRFGFELTFFRQALTRQSSSSSVAASGLTSAGPARGPNSYRGDKRASAFTWPVEDVYLAHLALTDIDGHKYLHAERLNRAGPGLAGAELKQSRLWNGNWEVRWQGDIQQLQAIVERFTLQLSLRSLKPPVINGQNGVSQKASGRGRASYYISLTRLEAKGNLTLGEQTCAVTALAWMDHEFFTAQLDPAQAGWDWLGLQLDDGSELMLYRLRRKDGSVDPHSAGTYIDREGRAHLLTAAQFSLNPDQATWTSPTSRATYPIAWRLQVPSWGLRLDISTALQEQEFTGRSRFALNYWEGAIQAEGTRSSRAAKGLGYLEMTGYDRSVDLSR